MYYCSTRNKSIMISPSEAVLNGISCDGGLYVPCSFPEVDSEFISTLCSDDYIKRADKIIKLFLSDYSDKEISECTVKAYGSSFEDNNQAPIVKLGNGKYVMELWHGPTCAFKDLALQILPHFMVKAAEKNDIKEDIVILTATSGDTGKAALEGFKNIKGTEIGVFYPENGVSRIQKLQMQTQEGDNVAVCGIEGNFDDAQTAVKSIFNDEQIKADIRRNGKRFSSANSINLGRLVPQIVYYISAYAELVKEKEIENGETINFAVPTGNFGNILAAYYAKKMGLPIGKLICASNSNNILTDFIETGIYDTDREFHMTESPSMDILISSNLERMLYDLSDDEYVNEKMSELMKNGKYYVSDTVLSKISDIFSAGFCDDTETEETIKKYYEEYSYAMDTHTAVAVNVHDSYIENTNDKTKTVIVSTASPYKFPIAVVKAITGEKFQDDFDAAEKLEKLISLPMPLQLKILKDREVRFSDFIYKSDIKKYVESKFGGEA